MNNMITQVGVRKAAYGAYAPILTADKLALVSAVQCITFTILKNDQNFCLAGERGGADCWSRRAARVGLQDARRIPPRQICRRPQPLDFLSTF